LSCCILCNAFILEENTTFHEIQYAYTYIDEVTANLLPGKADEELKRIVVISQ